MDKENLILAQRLPALLPELDRRYHQLRETLLSLSDGEVDEPKLAVLDLQTGDLLSAIDALLPDNAEEDQ